MSMKEVPLKAVPREKTDRKSKLRTVRASEMIPAVLYGKKSGSVPVAIERRTFELAYRDHLAHAFYVLDLAGAPRRTLLKDVQKHKLDGHILHVDFFEFDETKKTHFTVPVVTRGVSAGEKLGGILALVKKELRIRALPADIPEKIEIDVTALELNHSIRIRDLNLTAFEVEASPEDSVVSIVVPRGVEEQKGPAAAEGAAPAADGAKPAEGAAKAEAPKADAKAAPAKK